jgi:hypothetical protein
MKKASAGRVPVLESAFEIKLPWLLKQAKAMGTNTLVITDGDIRTVVELTPTRLATKLGGLVWVVDIVPIPCLGGRVRPLLKCPRAHEGNVQALYFRQGVLACRHCHELRYRTNLAATAADRARIARSKLLLAMGAKPNETAAERKPFRWRSKHIQQSKRLGHLAAIHYEDVQAWLERKGK